MTTQFQLINIIIIITKIRPACDFFENTISPKKD